LKHRWIITSLLELLKVPDEHRKGQDSQDKSQTTKQKKQHRDSLSFRINPAANGNRKTEYAYQKVAGGFRYGIQIQFPRSSRDPKTLIDHFIEPVDWTFSKPRDSEYYDSITPVFSTKS
jgi:hypothetical protein